MALAHNRKTLSGKVNMGKMLRETRDLRRFPMTNQQYKQFKELAKKHKLLFSVIRDKDGRGKLMDVILPVTELDRANAIFERILYTLPPEPERRPARELQQGREVFQPERQAPEKARQPQEKAKQAQPRERQVSKREKTVSGPVKGPSRAGEPPAGGVPGVNQAGPSESPCEPEPGEYSQKRFPVGTRLARYKNQLLYLQRERHCEGGE